MPDPVNPDEAIPDEAIPDEAIPDASGENADLLLRTIEAVVFAADEPVQGEEIARVYADVTGATRPGPDEIAEGVEALNEAYLQTGRSFRIHAWGGGYRMATDPSMAAFIKSLFQKEETTRLTRSLMETLAIAAYRQPVTKPEVDFVRGVNSDYALRKLLELGLLDVVGRSDSLGRPLLYGTTRKFLEQFGLASLEALPNLREIEDILNDPAFNRERARLLALEGFLKEEPDETQDHAEHEEPTAGEADTAATEPSSTSESHD